MEGTAKGQSTNQREINRIRKKWLQDQENVRVLKYGMMEYTNFINKMIEQGKISKSDLIGQFSSRNKVKSILLTEKK